MLKRSRRLLAFSLAFAYLLMTVGFGIRAHYCHGDLSSLTYVMNTPDCECGDEFTDMSCCDTVDQHFMLDEEATVPTTNTTSFAEYAHVCEILILELPDGENLSQESSDDFSIERGPPKYILHTSLILYA